MKCCPHCCKVSPQCLNRRSSFGRRFPTHHCVRPRRAAVRGNKKTRKTRKTRCSHRRSIISRPCRFQARTCCPFCATSIRSSEHAANRWWSCLYAPTLRRNVLSRECPPLPVRHIVATTFSSLLHKCTTSSTQVQHKCTTNAPHVQHTYTTRNTTRNTTRTPQKQQWISPTPQQSLATNGIDLPNDLPHPTGPPSKK